MSEEEDNVPVSVLFDDLMRDIDHYMSYNCDNEFLEFIINQEECRKKWSRAEEECIRLQGQVQLSHSEIERQEKKIQDTRRQLEIKLEAMSRFEKEKNNMDIKMRSAITLINSYLSDMRVGAETKERLSGVKALLEGSEPKKVQQQFSRSPGAALDTISEAETTDLSMTQSEDDLDASNARTRSRRGKRSRNIEVFDSQANPVHKKRKSGQKQMQTMEGSSKDQVIAQTIVSISREREIKAVSTLETYSGKGGKEYQKIETHKMDSRPSAPLVPATSESESDASSLANWAKSPVKPTYNTRLSVSKMQQQNQSMQRFTPSVSSFGRTLSNLQSRSHAFVQKTVFKPETCDACGKRIKFNKTKFCCRDCKAACHPECKDRVPVPCVPSSTPGRKAKLQTLADYAPQTHPMVPALIQHCVNEIEARGLQEVGLYRVPGAEKEVKELSKELKERFLRQKGVPNLARYNIETICGCIKNFLRGLEEPIVGRWFWQDFATAADLHDPQKREIEIKRIINDLPPPNQDTLAFLVLHLRKISTVKAVEMPIENFARIFGPTIIGYSVQENQLDATTMLQDTKKQQMVMETILRIDDNYWKEFIHRPSPAPHHTRSSTLKVPAGTPTGIPNNISKTSIGYNNGGGKKIYFTDDSPSPHKTSRQKKPFFD